MLWSETGVGVGGGEQAAIVLSTVKAEGLKARGEDWPESEKSGYEDMIRQQYETQGHPLYASARLWDDGVIDPVDTRRVLAHGLAAAVNNMSEDEAPYGIFRM